MKYIVEVPLVGSVFVTCDAENEEEAKEKALDMCCDFENENVEINELYGVKYVSDGCVVIQPCWDIDVYED